MGVGSVFKKEKKNEREGLQREKKIKTSMQEMSGPETRSTHDWLLALMIIPAYAYR